MGGRVLITPHGSLVDSVRGSGLRGIGRFGRNNLEEWVGWDREDVGCRQLPAKAVTTNGLFSKEDEAEAGGTDDGFGAALGLEFAHDGVDVEFDGVFADT